MRKRKSLAPWRVRAILEARKPFRTFTADRTEKAKCAELLLVRVKKLNVAGALFFIAGTLMLLGIVAAEATYPGYSVSQNYISDLGGAINGQIVQPAATVFDGTVVVGGLLMIAGAHALHRALDKGVFPSAPPLLITLAGLGSVGVGVFNETFGVIHWLLSVLLFIAAGLAAIMAFSLQKAPLRYFSVILGVIALVFSIGPNITPAVAFLGVGGAERWAAYALVLWLVGFGGHLMGTSSGATTFSARPRPLANPGLKQTGDTKATELTLTALLRLARTLWAGQYQRRWSLSAAPIVGSIVDYRAHRRDRRADLGRVYPGKDTQGLGTAEEVIAPCLVSLSR
jgi:hypothetical membrane protein